MADANAPVGAPVGAPSRRDVIAAAAGFSLAFYLPSGRKALAADAVGGTFAPNAFIRVSADNFVTVLIKHIEFGQGTFTGLATLAAEEMDADWALVRAEHSPADDKLYGNILFGGIQGTGGSSSIASSYDIMRRAGAAARAMFVAAAAKLWSAPATAITVSNSIVSHSASGRRATFGELAAAAAKEAAPSAPKLKSPMQFKLIGKNIPKIDTKAKTTGAAKYALDHYPDGLLTVVVARPRKFGAKIASFDDTAARQISGVVDVKKIAAGVAVYGTNTYAALRGRKALNIVWDDSTSEKRSSAALMADCIAATHQSGVMAGQHGDVAAGMAKGVTKHEAEFYFPLLAHAPMEPLDAVVAPGADGTIDVWTGSQFPTADKPTIAAVCGVDPSRINLNTVLAGGSFGRRAQWDSHFAHEAAEVFMAIGAKTPVKLVWTREDDLRGGYYRPATAHRIEAALGGNGEIVAWRQVVAGQSIFLGTPMEALGVVNGIDTSMVEGAAELPYATENFEISANIVKSSIPTLWWRSVGHTHTGYAVEVFIDQLLEKAGKDPIEGRIALLTDPKQARLVGVLKKVRAMAAAAPTPQGRARGVAAVFSFNSYVAEIAEVSNENGFPRIHKVWCAVDCGVAVNPDVIRAQMEGGIGYGLGAILFDDIEIADGGEIITSNFDNYRSLHMHEMPEVEVAIIASAESPTGVGEPGVPPIGPAVANAFRRLTGKSVQRLPFIRMAEG